MFTVDENKWKYVGGKGAYVEDGFMIFMFCDLLFKD